MSFGLKNAGATYQRLVNKNFEVEVTKSVEVYVDDILVKISSAEVHLKDLARAFEIFRRYKMKLNPAKCTFAVEARKFLGFMISR